MRQTLRDFTGDPCTLEVARVQRTDGRWVPALDFRDTREQTVVVFWRNVAAVEVLDAVERAA
ncbi:hypothetical protein [Pseudonocardia sp.]|uniref:hypothetical protein n=1 Tax=Pseudonocardia sp. TaxID=60912 RepID=UPI00261DBB98|nr:hypothetical protein [Pseudonocardia sp.]